MAKTFWVGVELTLGVAEEANGFFMLASPERYFVVPAQPPMRFSLAHAVGAEPLRQASIANLQITSF
jgi:hypothetical protein